MYDEYLEQFMPSIEIRQYLKGKELRTWAVTEMIYYSPVSIEKKKAAFYSLYETAKNNDNAELAKQCKMYIDNIELFLDMLAQDGVFSVSLCRYDENIKDTDYDFHCVCASLEDVLEYEKEDKKWREMEQDEAYWYSVEKWIKNEAGKYINCGQFVLVGGAIILNEVEDDFRKDFKEDLYRVSMYRCTDINLPVPYKAGDILEIDRFPFGPKIKILIIQVGDNLDCCCLQALSKTEEGLWHIGAVKHGMIGYSLFPQLSPLYFAKKWEGELQDKEGEIILEVQKYLNGDDEKGENLLEKFMHDITDEELLEVIREV